MKQKISIKINGNLEEVEVDFTEEQWEALRKQMNIKYNHTGYERAKKYFCIIESAGKLKAIESADSAFAADKGAFASGNYFTDRQIAEDRAKLFNILNAMYRWAAENTEPTKAGTNTYRVVGVRKGIFELEASIHQKNILPCFKTLEDFNIFVATFSSELDWLFNEFTYRL